jgi:uncharacterized protein
MATDRYTCSSSIDVDNIFVIPVGENKNIVYLPVCNASFYINNEGASAIMRYKKHIPFSPDEFEIQEVLNNIFLSQQSKIVPSPRPNPIESNSISIILHQKCNLECSYCFAYEDRGKESLKFSSVKQIIDSWIVRKGKKSVTFIGGGEPTLNWKLFYYAIHYIRQCDKSDEVAIKVVTNGTLLNENKLRILEENRVKLTISFDILPDIQNSQRKYHGSNNSSYTVVDTLIRRLKHYKIDFGIRSTITEESVSRMPLMVKYVADNYQHVKKLHLEHITDDKLSTQYHKDYTHFFFEARNLGKKLGIDVFNSFTVAQKSIKHDGFCYGDKCFIPQPDGSIIYSFCHRISHVEKENDNKIRISTFLTEGIHCPNRNYTYFTMPNKCNKCFARWHCAGGCLAERLSLTPHLLETKCEMVKEFCKRLLIEEMNSCV